MKKIKLKNVVRRFDDSNIIIKNEFTAVKCFGFNNLYE